MEGSVKPSFSKDEASGEGHRALGRQEPRKEARTPRPRAHSAMLQNPRQRRRRAANTTLQDEWPRTAGARGRAICQVASCQRRVRRSLRRESLPVKVWPIWKLPCLRGLRLAENTWSSLATLAPKATWAETEKK